MKISASLKWLLVFAGVFAFRLMPLRAPNVEPVLAATMPLSKSFGALSSVLFAVASIVLYDALTAGVGIWTLVPAAAYGLLALASTLYFKKRAASRGNFVGFSIAAVIVYDALTGLTTGPIFEGQSFTAALVGQIPFTALHLLGAVVFAALVSPALYRWLATEASLAPAPQKAPVLQ
jgi:hypothetical protein